MILSTNFVDQLEYTVVINGIFLGCSDKYRAEVSLFLDMHACMSVYPDMLCKEKRQPSFQDGWRSRTECVELYYCASFFK